MIRARDGLGCIDPASKERPTFMKTLAALGIAICALMWSAGSAEAADSMRCGSRLISAGDPREKVLNECGQPSDVETWEEERFDYFDRPPPSRIYKEFERYGGAYRVRSFIRVEVWTYNYGPSRFIDYVRLENGKVRKIYSGGYGY
jgi:hypothetical protein